MAAGVVEVSEGHGRARGLFFQIVTTVALSMTYFNMAASLSFSGVLTEQLTSADTDLALTANQVAWVTSIYNVGNVVGFIVSTYANPQLGTLRVVQLCSPATSAGWLLMAFGTSFWTLLAGRALAGVAIGTCTAPIITHVGEIASVHVRSFLTTLLIVNGCNGIMCAYLLGWLLGWRHAGLVIGIAPMAVQFATTLLLPRSARWLVAKGRPEEEAERSLRFYHGGDYDVRGQIAEIRESLGEAHRHDATVLQVLALLRHRHNLVPVLLMFAMYVLFVFSGGLTATSFAPVIFKEVEAFSNPYISSVLLGAVRMIATIFAGIVMDRMERKTLLMINGAVGSLACLATGCYFFYSDQLQAYTWIPLVSILTIVVSMSFGISPLKTVMFSELLPNAIRAEVGGILLLSFGMCNFIMVYVFPLAMASLGMSGMFWLFTVLHVLMALFAMFCLPRTRGKSIEAIQKIFVKTQVNTALEPVRIHVDERGGRFVAQIEDAQCADKHDAVDNSVPS